MKVKNSEIWNAKEPLQTISELKFPVKTSLQMARLINKIQEEYQIIDQVRIGLIRKHGEKDEIGNITVVGPNDSQNRKMSPNWNKFAEEFSVLMDQDTEIVFDKIKLPETLEIESSILVNLEKFIEA